MPRAIVVTPPSRVQEAPYVTQAAFLKAKRELEHIQTFSKEFKPKGVLAGLVATAELQLAHASMQQELVDSYVDAQTGYLESQLTPMAWATQRSYQEFVHLVNMVKNFCEDKTMYRPQSDGKMFEMPPIPVDDFMPVLRPSKEHPVDRVSASLVSSVSTLIRQKDERSATTHAPQASQPMPVICQAPTVNPPATPVNLDDLVDLPFSPDPHAELISLGNELLNDIDIPNFAAESQALLQTKPVQLSQILSELHQLEEATAPSPVANVEVTEVSSDSSNSPVYHPVAAGFDPSRFAVPKGMQPTTIIKYPKSVPSMSQLIRFYGEGNLSPIVVLGRATMESRKQILVQIDDGRVISLTNRRHNMDKCIPGSSRIYSPSRCVYRGGFRDDLRYIDPFTKKKHDVIQIDHYDANLIATKNAFSRLDRNRPIQLRFPDSVSPLKVCTNDGKTFYFRGKTQAALFFGLTPSIFEGYLLDVKLHGQKPVVDYVPYPGDFNASRVFVRMTLAEDKAPVMDTLYSLPSTADLIEKIASSHDTQEFAEAQEQTIEDKETA